MSYVIPPEDCDLFKFVSYNNIKGNPNTSTKQIEPKARYRGNYYTIDTKRVDKKLRDIYNEEKLKPFLKDMCNLECEMGKYQMMKNLQIPYDDIQKFIDPRFEEYDEENIRNFLRQAIVEKLERVNAEIRKLLNINFKFIFTGHVKTLDYIATKYHEMLNQLPFTDRELTMREEKKRIDKFEMIDTSHNEESDENETEKPNESESINK